MAANELGIGPCLRCKADVAYREDRAGNVFYRCQGDHDPKGRACGMIVQRFGKKDGDAMKADFSAATEQEDENGDEAQDETEIDGERAEEVDAPEAGDNPPIRRGKRKPADKKTGKPVKRSVGGHSALYD